MNDRPHKLQEVQELTSRLLDEQIDDAGHARLEELLFGDPEACELYLNLVTLHAHLSREHGGELPVNVPPVGLSETPHHEHAPMHIEPKASSFRLRFRRYAVAATVLLVIGLAATIVWRARHLDPANAVATVMELRDVDWAQCSAVHAVGDRLEPSTIGLNRGTAIIKFDNGAVATLTGPIELQIESRKSAELRHGTIVVRAEKEAAGFALRTSASDYIDLGTEFGVSVNDDASSEVHVFEGAVIARPRASDQVVPVLRNEAGRVEADRGDLIAIEWNAAKFHGVTTSSHATRPDAAVAVRPVTTNPTVAGGSMHKPLPHDARIIFLGDRATDRETHLLLIHQVFVRDMGPFEHPKLYNAGITLPLAFSEEEFAKFVLSRRPTHAVVEFGPEIVVSPSRRTAQKFDAEVRRLVDRLTASGIEPIIATGFRLGEQQAQFQTALDEYNGALRKLAAERKYRLADIDAHFHELEPCKLSLVVPNGALPTFTGCREMASVLLASTGYPDKRIDSTLRPSLLPGVVTQWHYRVKHADQVLTAAQMAAVEPDLTWRTLVLPQPDDKFLSRMADCTHSCTYRDRERGFATNLPKGKDQLVEAVAFVGSAEGRQVYLNTGAGLRTVWLNGQNVYDTHGRPTAWHPGAERVPVMLRRGENQLVIEAAGSFFVSLTDEQDWAVQ